MRPTRGSSSTSSATASATLARIGATWNRSMRGVGFGVRARMAASRIRSGVSPASGSGARPAKRSSGPTRAREAAAGLVGERAEQAGDVLERLALEQPGEQQVALLPQGELVVEVDGRRTRQQAAGLELDERGGDQQELGGEVEVERLHALDLDQVGVDDAGQADLVDVDLFGQDQLQEQVERTLVGPVGELGRDVDRHVAGKRYWRLSRRARIGAAGRGASRQRAGQDGQEHRPQPDRLERRADDQGEQRS